MCAMSPEKIRTGVRFDKVGYTPDPNETVLIREAHDDRESITCRKSGISVSSWTEGCHGCCLSQL